MRKLKIFFIAVFVKIYFKIDWNTAKSLVKFHYDFKK